ncbi:hypothetical protein F0344_27370 [Streptomyces finlayi]|uniref:Uncharacterized protein n=1 Tax=Streptomyces finlayi TaxID=67296 RepID=A0A7G7BR50_9ACTN|nr:hypothetical protein F0344_27370 [Streptomyces finlayi]
MGGYPGAERDRSPGTYEKWIGGARGSQRLDPGRHTAVVHVNPVYDADGFDVRRLTPSVPTAGIRDAEDLPALVELA